MGLAYDGVVKKQLFFIEFDLYQVLLLQRLHTDPSGQLFRH